MSRRGHTMRLLTSFRTQPSAPSSAQLYHTHKPRCVDPPHHPRTPSPPREHSTTRALPRQQPPGFWRQKAALIRTRVAQHLQARFYVRVQPVPGQSLLSARTVRTVSIALISTASIIGRWSRANRKTVESPVTRLGSSSTQHPAAAGRALKTAHHGKININHVFIARFTDALRSLPSPSVMSPGARSSPYCSLFRSRERIREPQCGCSCPQATS